jgi:hypothetical protein
MSEVAEKRATRRDVYRAKMKAELAAKALVKVVQEAYPIGCWVRVVFPRYEISGPVVAHASSWWHNAGRILVRNHATGKDRWVNPAYESTNITIIE